MSQRFSKLRALFARVAEFFNTRPYVAMPGNTKEFFTACKELAFWSASDAGLDGQIDAFDGSLLHPAADGLCTIRCVLKDTFENRAPADAAALVLRSLSDLRALLLLEIDGCRFVSMAPNVNPGVRELGRNFTNRSGRAG